MNFCFFDLFVIFAIVDLFSDFLFSPKVLKTFKCGLWIKIEIWKNIIKIGINGFGILKNGLFILGEIWKIGIEILNSQKDFIKILKNGFKIIRSILRPKIKREKNKNRKIIKIQNRRAKSRKIKIILDSKPTGISKPDEENIEKARNGKIFYFMKN